MAGGRHGKHNSTTVSFRVNSYEKATIEIIRSEMREMSLVLEDVAKDLKSEKPVISEAALDSMTERYLAFLEAALWMLKGSSYLWEDK